MRNKEGEKQKAGLGMQVLECRMLFGVLTPRLWLKIELKLRCSINPYRNKMMLYLMHTFRHLGLHITEI